MFLKYLLIITICCYNLQPIKAFIYSFEDAINLFSNSDNVFAKLTTNQNTINERNLLCDQQFGLFVDGLQDRVEWAVWMFDAWGKLPAGLAFGNTVTYGNYDQCMSIQQPLTTQSCLLPLIENSKIHLLDNIDIDAVVKQQRAGVRNADTPLFSSSVCVPAVCDPSRVPSLVNEFVQRFNLSVPVFNAANSCQSDARASFTAVDWMAVAIFSLFGCLLIGSTTYDVVMKGLKRTPSNVLRSFSVYTNGNRLLNCEQSKSPDNLQCLNAMRVLSIVWVVFLHTNFLSFFQPNLNAIYIDEWAQNLSTMIYHTGDIAVDTFLVMAGLLVAWQFFKEREQKKKLNILKSYMHRYFRITPVIAAAILFIVTLFKYMGDGPVWNANMEGTIRPCEEYWWSALLHLQNYVNPSRMCIGPSWYLSLDMQLFIISPFLLYPIWKWGKKFTLISVFLIIFSVVYTFTMVYIHEFPLSFLQTFDVQIWNQFVYFPTHARMGPYLIGLLTGYVMHGFKGKTVHIRRRYVIAAWTATFAIIMYVIFGTFMVHRPYLNETVLQSALHQSLARNVWALAHAWIIFACTHGYGGAVNWFLSFTFWQPIAKLSYCIYVLHILVITFMSAQRRQVMYFSNIQMLYQLWGDFGFSLMVSLLWTLSFEIPIPILENFLLNGCSEGKKNTEIPAKSSVNDDNVKVCDNNEAVIVMNKEE